MANELKQSGAQSATFYVPSVEGPDFGSLTVTDWAALPAGQLKTLLNKAYLTAGESPAPDVNAFLMAYATVGGMTETIGYYDDGETTPDLIAVPCLWTLDASGYPLLTANSSAVTPANMVARIVTRYSASE